MVKIFSKTIFSSYYKNNILLMIPIKTADVNSDSRIFFGLQFSASNFKLAFGKNG